MAKLICLLIVSFLILGLTLATSVAVMIYGWGLTPQSWWWIIGGAIAQFAFLLVNGLIQSAMKSE